MTSGERGFALVAVLLVLGLLGIIGAEFAYSMRLEASATRAWRDNISAAHLAEAGLEQAIRELSGDVKFASEAVDGLLTFYSQAPGAQSVALPRLPRARVRLGPGEFSYRITDEQARMSVNTVNPQPLDKLLQCLGIDKNKRDQIVDSILDWIDPNEEHRLNGAESDDYYLTLPTPYRARNGPLESINELLQIKGVTPALFTGVDGRPGLADVFTAATKGTIRVNVNTAGPVVLCGLGASEAQISSIIQGRRETPYVNLTDAASTVQGLTTTSETFRVEAEGLIEGRPRASLTAVVKKSAATTTSTSVVVVEWSGVR
jgi:general secretion pathway protein K